MTSDSGRPAEDGPRRIGALAKLPLFHDLSGRRALVAGGSNAAAWKAELLAAAGARVTVLTPRPDAEMTTLAARGAADGAILIERRSWQAGDLDGMAIALCDADDDAEAAAFHSACRAAGVICNVIDKPAFCDVFFGSIVNRSPIVVGISTDGAAPILGQAIRTRIEALLPRSLAGWAAAAKAFRVEVSARLQSPLLRRRFWEAFARLAFARGHENAASATRKLAECIARDLRPEGRVTFIQADPGDPELLTIGAVRVLQSADTIVFDDSVGQPVLEMARREAKRVPIRKTALGTSALILREAGRGRHVAVLHGTASTGCSFGADVSALRTAGITFELVPDFSRRRGEHHPPTPTSPALFFPPHPALSQKTERSAIR